MPRLPRGLVLAGALMVLAGCGVTGNSGSDGAKQPAVTKGQLAVMVLPADELGASIQGLQVDESGVVDNKDAADDSVDPDDTGENMKGDGRVSGYELSYEHPKLIASKGALGVGTMVDLFQDPVYAAQFLHERLNDYERFTNVPGLKFSRYSEFEAVAIGDEGAGQHLTITIPGVVTGYETEVVFRRGRIVARVAIARADRKDVRDEALKLAIQLDRRIQAVLAGEIEVEPVRPEESPAATAAELRKLPSLTLAPADIGPGVRVAKKGWRSGDDFHAYYRQFTDVTVGGSHLLSLRGETQLYESPAKAELALAVLGKQAGRQILTENIVESALDEAGVKPTNVRVRPLAGLGTGSTGTVVTFRLVGTTFTMATIFTRSGRVVQAVMGMCRSTDFDPDDLKPVAERAGRRLAA